MQRLKQLTSHLQELRASHGAMNTPNRAFVKSDRSLSGSANVDSSGERLSGNLKTDHAGPRLSASLIVIKPLEKPSYEDGEFNYRTLLLERNSGRGSFRSAHVFPGGNIDEDDYALSKMTDLDSRAAPLHALKCCAIRETFEESGILVGTAVTNDRKNSIVPQLPAFLLPSWRQKILDQSERFSNLVKLLKSDFDREVKMDTLWYCGNYLTPLTFPKRWNTHFFLSVLPEDCSTNFAEPGATGIKQAVVDGLEAVSMSWLTPLEAITLASSSPATTTNPSPINLAPPQFYFLAELCMKLDHSSIFAPPTRSEKLYNGGGEKSSMRRVIEFVPEIIKPRSDGGRQEGLVQMVLPGDPLHSGTEALTRQLSVTISHLRHRMYIRPPTASNSGFLTPVGVERIGMQKILGPGWEDMVVGQVEQM